MNYITNEIRNDGFGAQYQSIIGTILYAELNNYEYIKQNYFLINFIIPYWLF